MFAEGREDEASSELPGRAQCPVSVATGLEGVASGRDTVQTAGGAAARSLGIQACAAAF